MTDEQAEEAYIEKLYGKARLKRIKQFVDKYGKMPHVKGVVYHKE